MAEDIKYIGVEPDYTESPKKEGKVSNKNKAEKKERFKTNKYNSKVEDFIKSTKPKYKHTCKVITILFVVILVLVFKPIHFLQAKLEEKRAYYAQNESNDISLNYNLFDNLVYATSYNYYKDLRGTLGNPLNNSSLNAPFDLAHPGVDLNGYNGQEALSVKEGIVVQAGNDEKHGNFVMIEHNIKGYTIYTYYSNLGSIAVYEGQYVSQGQVIGTITGKDGGVRVLNKEASHLHFAVRKSTKESSGMNPLMFIKK